MPAKKEKKKVFPLAVDDELMQVVKMIQEKSHSTSLSAAIRFAIFEAQRSLFPAYLMNKGSYRNKEDRDAEKQKEIEAQQMELVKQLDGRVENGVCIYYAYHLRKRYEQRVSLGLLHKDMVATQYDPNKEVVMKLKAEGKTEW